MRPSVRACWTEDDPRGSSSGSAAYRRRLRPLVTFGSQRRPQVLGPIQRTIPKLPRVARTDGLSIMNYVPHAEERS